MIPQKAIQDACDKAYKQVGDNAYFANGFSLGVKFAIEYIKASQKQDVVCNFCNKSKPVDDVYFLDGTLREDGSTVICETCESKEHIIF